MNEENNSRIFDTALALYLRLPWWKGAQFRKWYRSNNWDVLHIYERCLEEARAIARENERYSEPNPKKRV